MRILITGATGCVGQYLVAELLSKTDHDLVLILRNPSKLDVAPEYQDRISVHHCDLAGIADILPDLPKIDTAILVATAWGGDEAQKVTVNANVNLTKHLADAGCKRVLYFATASVLDGRGEILPAARELGTEYIKAKYQLVETMETLTDKLDIVGLYPTLIIGGSKAVPKRQFSHLAGMMPDLLKWTWLMRYFKFDARFHLIHAQDIATLTRHLCDQPITVGQPAKRYVLGLPAVSYKQMIGTLATLKGLKPRGIIPLSPAIANLVIKLFRIEMAPWDRYCLAHPDQGYDDAYYPSRLEYDDHMPDILTGFRQLGL